MTIEAITAADAVLHRNGRCTCFGEMSCEFCQQICPTCLGDGTRPSDLPAPPGDRERELRARIKAFAETWRGYAEDWRSKPNQEAWGEWAGAKATTFEHCADELAGLLEEKGDGR